MVYLEIYSSRSAHLCDKAMQYILQCKVNYENGLYPTTVYVLLVWFDRETHPRIWEPDMHINTVSNGTDVEALIRLATVVLLVNATTSNSITLALIR